jgi:hemolysin activation/secretion protein
MPSTSAGIIEKQIEGEFSVRELPSDKSIPLLEVDIPKEHLNIPEGLSTYIQNIYLTGNTVLSSKKIEKILYNFKGKELTGKDVLHLCMQIECLYAENGYILAWVYPPVQTIEDDTLHLCVLEGTLDHIQIEGNTSYTTSYLYRYVANLEGKPFNYNALMKALLLMNENIDCSAEGILKKSKELGCVDLFIRVQDQFPAHINAGYNNWGSNITSYSQMTSEIDVGNIAMSGDLFTLMTSTGIPPTVMYYLNPVYSIPLNGSGTRCNLSYTFSHSNIQQLKELDLACWTEIGAISFIQPIYRSTRFDLDISTGFSAKQYKNFAYDYTISYDKLRVLSIGCNLDYLDCLRGRSFASAFLTGGIPYIFNGSAPIDPDCSREGAGGRYFILNIGLQRVQSLPYDLSLMITSSAQGTFNKLPLSEQFVIGGATTVRGYPSCVAAGDVGYCINSELYIPIPGIKNKTCHPCKKPWKNVLQLLAFIDHGGVYTNTSVPSELSPAYLTSIGAGLRFYGPRNLNISFDAAFPLTNQYKLFNSTMYVRITMDLL